MGSATISHIIIIIYLFFFIPDPFHLLTWHVLILQLSITTLKSNKCIILISYVEVRKKIKHVGSL